MRLFPDKKPTEPRTEIDRIVGKVWLVSSLSLIPIFLFSLFHGLSYRHSLFELITLDDGYGNGNNRNDRSFENIHRRRTYLYGSFSPLPFIRLFPEKNRNF